MRRSKSGTAVTLLVVAAIAGGCGRREPQPVAAPAAAPADAPPATAAPSAGGTAPADTADARAIAALPPGVNLYYSWDCEGGLHLVMKNLVLDRAISLETHEGARKLPQAVSASGARYSDGTITFWTKGDTATYQREGGAELQCRLASSSNSRP